MRKFGTVVLWILSVALAFIAVSGVREVWVAGFDPTVYYNCAAIFMLALALNPLVSRVVLRTSRWRIAGAVAALVVTAVTIAEVTNYAHWQDGREDRDQSLAFENIYVEPVDLKTGGPSIMGIVPRMLYGGAAGRPLSRTEAEHLVKLSPRAREEPPAIRLVSHTLGSEPDEADILITAFAVKASVLPDKSTPAKDAVQNYLSGGSVNLHGDGIDLTFPLCRSDIQYSGTGSAEETAAGIHPVVIYRPAMTYGCSGDDAAGKTSLRHARAESAHALSQSLLSTPGVTLEVHARDGTLVVSGQFRTDRLAEAEAKRRDRDDQVRRDLNSPFSPFTWYPWAGPRGEPPNT